MSTSKCAAACICATLWLAGCSSDASPDSQAVTVSDADGVVHVRVESLAPADVPAWETREIFTTSGAVEPIELYFVTAARFLADGTLALANAGTGEVVTLDAMGALDRRMGGKGAGPGEFVWISTLDVDTAGNIVAYDPRQGRLTRLTSTGTVVETRPLAPPNRVVDLEPLATFDDGRIAAVYGEMRRFALSGEKRDTTPLMLFTGDGSHPDTIGLWPATEWAFISFADGATRKRVGFGRTAAYSGRGARVAIGSTDSVDIAVFDGSDEPSMRITGGPGPQVESGDVDLWREDLVDSRSTMPEEIKRAMADIPHRETYPAFEELVVDDAGRIWIGSYVRPGVTQREWLVIGADGHAQGRVTLPATARVLDIAGDRIALLSRDDLDEETVSVLRIMR